MKQFNLIMGGKHKDSIHITDINLKDYLILKVGAYNEVLRFCDGKYSWIPLDYFEETPPEFTSIGAAIREAHEVGDEVRIFKYKS